MGALLACGDGAVLSHRSAAALWGISHHSGTIDVTAPCRSGRRRPGLRLHRADRLVEDDVTVEGGIPCTVPARTLLDLAGVVDRRTLERAVDRAETLRLFDLHALREAMRRNPRRRGSGVLRAVLERYSGPAITRSDAEEMLLAATDGAGLARPRVNAWIPLPDGGGYEADFLWAAERLIVEVDGRAHHATARAFAHDRKRDRRLAAIGFETRRFAAAELQGAPGRVAAEIAGFLTQRSSTLGHFRTKSDR